MVCNCIVEFVFGVVISAIVLLTMFKELSSQQDRKLKDKEKEVTKLLAELSAKTSAIQELIRGVHHEGPNENLKRIRALLGLYLMDQNINYLKQAVEEAKKAEDKILNHVKKYNHLQ